MLNIIDTIETMRKVVKTYDDCKKKLDLAKERFETAKYKVKSTLEDERVMKFGTVIGIVVGAITLIAAGAAAAYFFFKHREKCCEEDDELFDDFPEEEIITDSDEEAKDLSSEEETTSEE